MCEIFCLAECTCYFLRRAMLHGISSWYLDVVLYIAIFLKKQVVECI